MEEFIYVRNNKHKNLYKTHLIVLYKTIESSIPFAITREDDVIVTLSKQILKILKNGGFPENLLDEEVKLKFNGFDIRLFKDKNYASPTIIIGKKFREELKRNKEDYLEKIKQNNNEDSSKISLNNKVKLAESILTWYKPSSICIISSYKDRFIPIKKMSDINFNKLTVATSDIKGALNENQVQLDITFKLIQKKLNKLEDEGEIFYILDHFLYYAFFKELCQDKNRVDKNGNIIFVVDNIKDYKERVFLKDILDILKTKDIDVYMEEIS